MNNLDLFEAELTAIGDTYPRPAAPDPADFLMRSTFAEWVDFGAGLLGMKATDMMNDAVIFGGMRWLALIHRLSLEGATPGGGMRGLPPPQAYDPGQRLAHVQVNLTDQAWSLSEWARQLHGIEVPALVDDGIRVLGSLAVMPPGTELCITCDGERLTVTPDIPYHLIGPLPPDA